MTPLFWATFVAMLGAFTHAYRLRTSVIGLKGQVDQLTRYNGRLGSYLKEGKPVHVRCLTTYTLRDTTYCVVENESSSGTTVYSIQLSRVTWNNLQS